MKKVAIVLQATLGADARVLDERFPLASNAILLTEARDKAEAERRVILRPAGPPPKSMNGRWVVVGSSGASDAWKSRWAQAADLWLSDEGTECWAILRRITAEIGLETVIVPGGSPWARELLAADQVDRVELLWRPILPSGRGKFLLGSGAEFLAGLSRWKLRRQRAEADGRRLEYVRL